MKFSANLGFLWNENSLPDAIHLAHKAGFDAVECHWPYQYSAQSVRTALEETGLSMLGLNTLRGDLGKGENGLSALPGREVEARAAIDQAIEYAVVIGAKNIHVMAGFSSGELARQTFITNLQYAADRANDHNITILIEPLNRYDAPGYFLSTSAQAEDIIRSVSRSNLKLMFDCYHLQLMEGDICNRLERLMPIIGHIQIASVPFRNEPDQGELNYSYIFSKLQEINYSKPIGAEYKPKEGSVNTRWMEKFKHL